MDDPPVDRPHRRFNPLSGEWVLVSPHRLDRPWRGAVDENDDAASPRLAYDPSCHLCPGNRRDSGICNPRYEGVFVFDNDYPALTPDASPADAKAAEPFAWHAENGLCRVVCFSPHHSKTLSHLDVDEAAGLVRTWVRQSEELGARFPDGSVQIFENKGEQMGCSNPHPHNQIWAQASVPGVLRKELEAAQRYGRAHASPLLIDYADRELARGERVVCANDAFVVVVPFWAVWPFETLVLPRRQVARLPELAPAEQADLGDIVRRLSRRYDRLFNVSFPYSSGIHQAPANSGGDADFTLHMHFYPPLLRSAEIRKFLVGYEMLAEAQRDITPESAARTLAALPDTRALPGTEKE